VRRQNRKTAASRRSHLQHVSVQDRAAHFQSILPSGLIGILVGTDSTSSLRLAGRCGQVLRFADDRSLISALRWINEGTSLTFIAYDYSRWSAADIQRL
jgi:hypothetical protein